MYSWRWAPKGEGLRVSKAQFTTPEAAAADLAEFKEFYRKHREATMGWAPQYPGVGVARPIFRTSRMYVPGVVEPKDVDLRGVKEATERNAHKTFLFHGTYTAHFNRFKKSYLKTHGILPKAMCEYIKKLEKWVQHSRLPPAVWGSPSVKDVIKHMASFCTIFRHESNKYVKFQEWHLITIMAFRRTEETVDKPMGRGARLGTYTKGAVEVVHWKQFDLSKKGVGRDIQKWADRLK